MHSLPLIVLIAIGDLVLIGLSVGFVTVRNIGSAIAMLGVGFVITAAIAAYFRNAAIFVKDGKVGKIDLLGRKTQFRIDDLDRTELRYSPQPNLWFVGKNGKWLFRVNTRLWTDSQLKDVQDALRAAGWRQPGDGVSN
jgi:hypothetical protein